MSSNPYESPICAERPQETRPTWWAIWSGIACLLVAALCFLLTVAGMVLSFHTLAQSSTTPTPADLANGISIAMISSFAAIPLGLLGIILVIVGLAVRRPMEESHDV